MNRDWSGTPDWIEHARRVWPRPVSLDFIDDLERNSARQDLVRSLREEHIPKLPWWWGWL